MSYSPHAFNLGTAGMELHSSPHAAYYHHELPPHMALIFSQVLPQNSPLAPQSGDFHGHNHSPMHPPPALPPSVMGPQSPATDLRRAPVDSPVASTSQLQPQRTRRAADTVSGPVVDAQPSRYGDADDDYGMEFASMAAFEAWRAQLEEDECVDFVKSDTHVSKANPPRFKESVKLVCGRHARKGRSKYVKKFPERQRKVPSRKLDGDGCPASISYKTYYDLEVVRVNYFKEHSHEIGESNLPFTKRRLKERPSKRSSAAQRDRAGKLNDQETHGHGETFEASASPFSPNEASTQASTIEPSPAAFHPSLPNIQPQEAAPATPAQTPLSGGSHLPLVRNATAHAISTQVPVDRRVKATSSLGQIVSRSSAYSSIRHNDALGPPSRTPPRHPPTLPAQDDSPVHSQLHPNMPTLPTSPLHHSPHSALQSSLPTHAPLSPTSIDLQHSPDYMHDSPTISSPMSTQQNSQLEPLAMEMRDVHWDRLSALFQTVRNNSSAFPYTSPSVVALETVLLRMFSEVPPSRASDTSRR